LFRPRPIPPDLKNIPCFYIPGPACRFLENKSNDS
jgi:hypothetical protein